MDSNQLWAAIDDQRRRTADLLATLTDDQWDHPSLCEGWTVRHVAAHLTLQQERVGDALLFMARHPSLLRSPTMNRVIHGSAVLQAKLPTDEIIRRIRSMIGSRRHNAFLSDREPLIDILVHGQDIAVPLRLELAMPVDATAEAATRVWRIRNTWLGSVNRKLPLDGHRLSATDTDWSVGDGIEVRGPIGALLLLVTGRPAALAQLSGEGAEALKRGALTA